MQATVIECGENTKFPSIQQALNAALPFDTIEVLSGYYKQGNIFIEKSLSLFAKGEVVIDGEFKCEVITVKSSHVHIKGFHIKNSSNLSSIDIAGIKVLASHHVIIEYNQVEKCSFGIYLSNTKHCIVKHNIISGNVLAETNIGNGIHCWKADSNEIENNEITNQRDGIYFEFVTNTTINKNFSHHNLRYGLHFMFSHSNTYTANKFSKNGAGVAVMYSHHVTMKNNLFDYNWGASSYGLLLKDINDSDISGNIFSYNSAAIYMEGSNRVNMRNNTFSNNGWALRMQASCVDNIIEYNNFIGNTFDVSTNGETQLSNFNANYWDKYEGYDLNRDGEGDIPYRPVSLFSVIVEQLPPSLLLIRSFMVYLLDKAEKIIPSLTPEYLIDNKPIIKMIEAENQPVASININKK
ncbi:MAG: nitrous oxide reductase family maturation protein NosD [Bacteroidetes bacterium]|nr:nitrous oxide reductase family maturation protein NosD [Bacteroidota bacterium]